MILDRFRITLIVRILFLAGSLYLDIYLWLNSVLYITSALVGLLVVFQFASLIGMLEKSNRDLIRFLDAIRYEDFTQNFSGGGLGGSFDELKNSFNEILHRFRQTRAEREESLRYLQTVVQHIGAGLIAFTTDGKIHLINTSARRLLKNAYPAGEWRDVNQIEKFSPTLRDAITQLKPGEKKSIAIEYNNERTHYMIQTTEFKLRERLFRLVSIQNIQNELDEKEMEAWQNLIRVLTHEIMNSMTPIASLASTADDLIQKNMTSSDPDTAHDVHGALQTIQNRSQSLIRFVDSYRRLTKLPKPQFKVFSVREFFDRVELLLKQKLAEQNIHLIKKIEPDTLEITADPDLIEQVLINLLINAVHAVEKNADPKIILSAGMDDGSHILLRVTDNGYGIVDEAMSKIFIPFFTTKPEGSGIGLSLARQIMRLHRGAITVQSKPKIETVFTLKF